MQPHNLNDCPEEVKELIDAVLRTADEMAGIEAGNIRIWLDEDRDVGVAHVTTNWPGCACRIVFMTDGSRRARVIPAGEDIPIGQ